MFNALDAVPSRGMRLTRIREQKGARNAAKKLSPTTDFMFGGQVLNLAQSIKASAELSPLALDFKPKKKPGFNRNFKGSGAGGSFTKYPKSRGGPSGRGKNPSNRGGRLEKFKD